MSEGEKTQGFFDKIKVKRNRRRTDDYHASQVIWSFVVALAVALAALQHVFVAKTNPFSETTAARSPGSLFGSERD